MSAAGTDLCADVLACHSLTCPSFDPEAARSEALSAATLQIQRLGPPCAFSTT